MAISVASGTFSTGTGTTTVNVTSPGFQPKAVILIGTARAATGSGGADAHLFVGVSTDSPDYDGGGAWASVDGAGTSDTARGRHVTASVLEVTTAGAWAGEAQLTMTASGFDVTISNAFPADVLVAWLAIGGADVSAAAGEFAMPASTGATTNLVTGLAFQPKCVITINAGRPSTGTDVSGAGWYFGFGVGTGTGASDQWAIGAGSVDAQTTTDTHRHGISGLCLTNVSNLVGMRASLDSFTSDGFELNVAETASGRGIIYLALGGAAEYVAGNFVTVTGTGTQPAVATTGVDPKALIIGSHCTAESTSDTTQDNNAVSLGIATSASSRYVAAVTDQDALASTSECWSAFLDTAVYARGDFADGTDGLADIAELGTGSEQFEWAQDDGDPDAAFVGYLAIGDAPASSTILPAMMQHYY